MKVMAREEYKNMSVTARLLDDSSTYEVLATINGVIVGKIETSDAAEAQETYCESVWAMLGR